MFDCLLCSKKENKQKKNHLLHFLIGSVHFFYIWKRTKMIDFNKIQIIL